MTKKVISSIRKTRVTASFCVVGDVNGMGVDKMGRGGCFVSDDSISLMLLCLNEFSNLLCMRDGVVSDYIVAPR